MYNDQNWITTDIMINMNQKLEIIILQIELAPSKPCVKKSVTYLVPWEIYEDMGTRARKFN